MAFARVTSLDLRPPPGRDERPAATGVVMNEQRAQVTFGLLQHSGQHPMTGFDVGRGISPGLDLACRGAGGHVLGGAVAS